MRLKSWSAYIIVGLIGTAIGWGVGGLPTVSAVASAWSVCSVPLLWRQIRGWVAKVDGRSKMVPKLGLPVSAREILMRLVWVLGASSVLYWRYGTELGIGFWVATLVFYQVALAVHTVERVREVRR